MHNMLYLCRSFSAMFVSFSTLFSFCFAVIYWNRAEKIGFIPYKIKTDLLVCKDPLMIHFTSSIEEN